MNDDKFSNKLAVERTRLANERTFLAYVRTALALAAGGVALLHFFPSDPFVISLAWLLIFAGGSMLAAGLHRFLVVGGKLKDAPQVPSRESGTGGRG